MRIQLSLWILIISMLSVSGCASIQAIDNLERRLSQLETENNLLRNKVQQIHTEMAGWKATENRLRDLYAGQGADFQSIFEKVNSLNGRIDETDYRLQQEIASIQNSLKNFDMSLDHYSETALQNKDSIQRVEKYIGYEPGGEANEKKRSASGTERLSEDDLYKVSKEAYDRADYETARQGFEKFLELFPKSDKADNARFWIGDVYYAEEWYQKAILEYQEVIEKYSSGNKIQSAYLKQGFAFYKLGETANALLVLKELIKKYPNTPEAGIARQKIAQIE